MARETHAPAQAGGHPAAAALACACAALVIAAGGPRARAGDGADPSGPHPEVRAQILSEFRFVQPAPSPEARPAVLLNAPPAAAADRPAQPPEVVLMRPFTVRETTRMAELKAGFAQEQAGALADSRMRRLGVGIHDVRVGPVHFYAGTLFYIPFVAGVAISW